MKLTCDNCGEAITDNLIESEQEINTIKDGIETDVPVIRIFCSEDCKKQYFDEVQ